MNTMNNNQKTNPLKITIKGKMVSLRFAIEPNLEAANFVKKA